MKTAPRALISRPAFIWTGIPLLLAWTALSTACSDESSSSGSGSGSSSSGNMGSGGAGGAGGGAPVIADFTSHRIAPKDTDPAIDNWMEDHIAGFDEKAMSNGKLLVHLAAMNGLPDQSILILSEAAHAGYHVIGLRYPNDVNIGSECASDMDANCYENMRLEVIDGMDRSPKINVNAANSIVNRLVKLLEYLNNKFPAEGWASYLDTGKPLYTSIAFSGHSQGGGHAALIARNQIVDRVLMFAAPPDGKDGNPPVPGKWVNANTATANLFYYGLIHTKDPAFNLITYNWTALNLGSFGVPVDADTISPPYANSHQLTTSLEPATGAAGYHNAIVVDADTPKLPDGKPALAPAWRHMLGVK